MPKTCCGLCSQPALARARDAVRQKVAGGLNADVLVLVRGGTYRQKETLAFGPRDSGTEKHSITYAAQPGQKVVLSGGRKITGWKKGEREIWTTELPEVKAGKWQFRQFFVNGKRAIRARTPNIDDKIPWWHIRTSTAGTNPPPPEDSTITASVTGPIQAYNHPSDVELVYIANNNTIAYNHIDNAMKVTVDGAGLYVTFSQDYPKGEHGCLVRGNLIHDVFPNRFHNRTRGQPGPFLAAGIYLDGHAGGYRFENNVVFRTWSDVFVNGRAPNVWLDNILQRQKNGTPPLRSTWQHRLHE